MQAKGTGSHRQSKVDVDLKTMLRFLWKIRLYLIIGGLTGAILGGAFWFMTRKEQFVTRLLLDLDKSSLPAITAGGTIAEELERRLQSYSSQKHLLFSIYQSGAVPQEKLNALDRLLLREFDVYMGNYEKSKSANVKKLRADSIFSFSPAPNDGGLVATMTLPDSGFKNKLGEVFVQAINEIIDSRNSSEMETQEALRTLKIQDEKKHIAFIRTTLAEGVDGVESDLIKIRTQLAAIEFDLLKQARKQDDITYFLTFNHTYYKDNTRIVNDPLNNLEDNSTSARLENIIQLISALHLQRKIDDKTAHILEMRISGLSMQLRRRQAELAENKDIEKTLSKRIGEASSATIIDRAKILLPRFKLNQAHFDSLLKASSKADSPYLERLVYTRQLSLMMAMGILAGMTLALFASVGRLWYLRNPSSTVDAAPEDRHVYVKREVSVQPK